MNLSSMLTALATQIPLMIVCMLGMVWALTALDRHRRVAMFVLAGLGLYLMLGVVQVFVQTPIHQMLDRWLSGIQRTPGYPLHYAAVGFAFNVIRAICMGLLVCAAFVDRPVMAMLAPQQPLR